MDGEEEKQSGERTLSMSIEDEPISLQAEQPRRSASPSTISTVSSASPLVRQFSGSSSSSSLSSSSSSRNSRVRPAPTSIAAAQLQCQMGADQVRAKQLQQLSSKQSGQQQVNKSGSSRKASKKAQQAEPTKSFGYNLAKSVAYRAYGFNGFWSTSGLRYMNFVCLLTTLVCLVTILLLSSSNGSSSDNNSYGVGIKPELLPRSSKSARTVGGQDEAVESIDSLDSQALASRPSIDRQTNSVDGQPDDEFDVISSPATTPTKSKLAEPKSRPKVAADREQTNRPSEREVEGDGGRRTWAHKAPVGWSPFDPPFFSQLMADLDLPEPQQLLVKPSGRAANSATFSWSKPAIRRGEDGATIILSTSGTFSSDSNNLTSGQSGDSPLSALLERLLPAGSSLSPSSASLASPSFSSFDPFGYPRRAPMFAPFGSLQHSHFLAPPMAFPSPSSLMSLVMRAAQTADGAADTNSTSSNLNKPAGAQSGAQNSTQSGSNSTQLRPLDSMEAPVRMRPSSAGTMLIVSSSASPSHDPFERSTGFIPFGPFASPQGVHLMELPYGGGLSSLSGDPFGSSAASAPLNSLLRGLLFASAHERAPKLAIGDQESSMGALDPEELPRSSASSEWDDSRTVHSLRARHRSDSPDEQLDPLSDANDLFSAADSEQHQQPQLTGRTLRQTIRGPGVTVERIIELPAGRQLYEGHNHNHRHSLAGLRSQSLSRADFAATDGNEQHRSISNERPMIHPAGFVGRLLADMSQRSEIAFANRARARSLQLERLDEPDESQEANDEPRVTSSSSSHFLGPQVRVASARIRMRPNELMMLPTNFNTADSDELTRDGSVSSPNDSARLSSSSSALDDTLNSMEDRLSQALDTNSDQSQQQHQNNPNSEAKQSGAIAVASLARGGLTHTAPVASERESNDRDTQDPQHQQQRHSDNPFTSPSSPLFGFPVSSAIVTSESTQSGTNRQPRGFTYHSNNELASPFVQHKPEVPEQQQVDIIARANMAAPVPPAAVAMGRRLDDGPSFGSDGVQLETVRGSA